MALCWVVDSPVEILKICINNFELLFYRCELKMKNNQWLILSKSEINLVQGWNNLKQVIVSETALS